MRRAKRAFTILIAPVAAVALALGAPGAALAVDGDGSSLGPEDEGFQFELFELLGLEEATGNTDESHASDTEADTERDSGDLLPDGFVAP